jgi:hypothetical protein
MATNMVSDKNLLYKIALKLTYMNAQSRIISLGPNLGEMVAGKFGKSIERVILPCGVFLSELGEVSTPKWKEFPNKVYFGYLGNCGIPHSSDFVKAAIGAINPDTQHLILAVYGTKSEEIKEYAANRQGVSILPTVPREELGSIDVHLVTLLETWTHIAGPSKAVSSICSGSTILFHGSRNSDNWSMLGEAGWIVDNRQEVYHSVKDCMSSITLEGVNERRIKAKEIAQKLNDLILDSYNRIASWAK